MTKQYLLFPLFLLFSIIIFAQKQTVSGVIKDSLTGETIIGANVIISGTTIGATSDVNGHYSIQLTKGKHSLQASFIGYNTQRKEIEVGNSPITLDFILKASVVLEGIEIIADYAKVRETPVAFTTILPAKIEERLSGQDIPLLLNKTPGVYATAQGGGDGDARITIRGFNQRNVAVMFDGIPVNDMENGWVYWSNWFGIDAVTRNIQVQRGLGASKLALPSVGGTMNIITKGIETKRSLTVEQGIDNNGKSTTNLGFTSGALKNGWGITMAGAYKDGKGWVEQTSVKAWFFYGKIDKKWKHHLTSLTAYGAPQTHMQRTYKRAIADFDTTYAKEHGVPSADIAKTFSNKGVGYNAHWGYLKRDAEEWNSDHTQRIIDPNAKKEVLNEQVNVFFKPQYSIRDAWDVNPKLSINNILYLSTGNGGGISPRFSLKNTDLISLAKYQNNAGKYSEDEIGQINWQSIYDQNSKGTITPFGTVYPINSKYSNTLYCSNNYLTEKFNNHVWYGLLSTLSYKVNNQLSLSGGIDLRSYRAEHYCQITDLLGGDYAIDKADLRNNYDADSSLAMKRVGDKVYYNYVGLIKWGGLFGLIEYKAGKFSSFANVSTSVSAYKKIDYFYNAESKWGYLNGYTIKTGANYNLDKFSNIFFNIGYLAKARDFKYSFAPKSAVFLGDSLDNLERVKALEFGYSYNSKKFSANLNTYMTRWINKASNDVRSKYIDKNDIEHDTYGIIPGMDARHLGVELDFVYKLNPTLDFQGLISIGDWIWDKKITNLQMYTTDNNDSANKISFDARGIHVGDAAQTQIGANLRYEPIKGLYFEGGATFFDRYYADFNPEECTDALGNPVESWRMPAYTIFDLHAGYRFKISPVKKANFTFKLNVLNLFDKVYVSDATNNDSYIQNPFNTSDARSASVFMGAPRTFSVSLKVVFD